MQTHQHPLSTSALFARLHSWSIFFFDPTEANGDVLDVEDRADDRFLEDLIDAGRASNCEALRTLADACEMAQHAWCEMREAKELIDGAQGHLVN